MGTINQAKPIGDIKNHEPDITESVIKDNIHLFSFIDRIDKCIEETAELMHSLVVVKKNIDNIKSSELYSLLEEIFDVEITSKCLLEQISKRVGTNISYIKKMKLKKFIDKVNELK